MYKSYSLLAEISAGSAQISGIVDTLKGYSYLDQAPIQAVDLADGLDKTLLILRRRIPNTLSIRREYAPDLPRIQAYGRELNQVWTNIIMNAIQALNGQGEIVLRANRDSQSGWVAVEIEDNGPGIAPEHLPKLFDPFFTTKAARQRDRPGSEHQLQYRGGASPGRNPGRFAVRADGLHGAAPGRF